MEYSRHYIDGVEHLMTENTLTELIFINGRILGLYDTMEEAAKALEEDFNESFIPGTAEYWNALKEDKKEHKLSQKDHLLKWMNENLDHYEIINEENYHYRIPLGNSKKLDVWLSTTKHSITGSNVYRKGFDNIKKIVKENR